MRHVHPNNYTLVHNWLSIKIVWKLCGVVVVVCRGHEDVSGRCLIITSANLQLGKLHGRHLRVMHCTNRMLLCSSCVGRDRHVVSPRDRGQLLIGEVVVEVVVERVDSSGGCWIRGNPQGYYCENKWCGVL